MSNPTNKRGDDDQSKEWAKLTTQVSSEGVKRKFKAVCAEEGIEMRVVVDDLIRAWLSERDN